MYNYHAELIRIDNSADWYRLQCYNGTVYSATLDTDSALLSVSEKTEYVGAARHAYLGFTENSEGLCST